MDDGGRRPGLRRWCPRWRRWYSKCSPRSPTPAPLEDDDLLSEFLLRLPPAPSALFDPSLVCKRWHRIVSDPHFLHRFRTRHRDNPPLLGFLKPSFGDISFDSILDPPDSILRGRFWLSLDGRSSIVSCRHGLVLIHDLSRLQLLVWDPVTFDQRWVAYPQEFYDVKGFDFEPLKGTVLGASGDVDGGVGLSHFQVVLVGYVEGDKQAIACVYSSETGEWGDIISTACPTMPPAPFSGIMVGDSFYWFLVGSSSIGVLEFNLDRQSLVVIQMPQLMPDRLDRFKITRTQDGGLGLLFLSSFRLQFWKRKTAVDAGWVLGSSVELDKLLSLSLNEGTDLSLYEYIDENNLLLVSTGDTMFVIQLDTMELEKSFEIFREDQGHSLSCVYVEGI